MRGRPCARRAGLVLLCCALTMAMGSQVARAEPALGGSAAAAITDGRIGNPVLMRERSERLLAAERVLATGDAAAALAQFEQAAMMLHAPDTEVGIVRSAMQMGQYRRALAFASHTAGAHLEAPAAAGLYAWLLRLGGQDAYAALVLEAAFQRNGTDPVLVATRRALAEPRPQVPPELLVTPYRFAPYEWREAGDGRLTRAVSRSETARSAGTAFLIDGGRRALAPLKSVDGAGAIQVRSALGQTRVALIDVRLDGLGLALLQLDSPFALASSSDAESATATGDPWAGSPGYVIGYATGERGGPAWPWLQAGFFGEAASAHGPRLGIASVGPGGAVVFDADGRWAGIALGADADGRWIPVSALRKELALLDDRPCVSCASSPSASAEFAAAAAPGHRPGLDAVYERAMPLLLQVLVQD